MNNQDVTFEKEYSKTVTRKEKLDLIRHASLQHPFYLGKYVLGYDRFEEIHFDMLSFVLGAILNGVPECIDLEPRGCFKTSAISITLPIWLELKNPDDNTLINHKVKAVSTSILEEIADHYLINKLFINLFGNRIGKIWRQGYIESRYRTKPSKEPTIAAGSVDKELVAGHYHRIINDDIVTLKDYLSKKERNKTVVFYNSVRYLAEDGSIINVGTRWHEDDIYGKELLKSIPIKHQRIKPIIDENKKLYFPNKYPIEKIKRLKAGTFLEEGETESETSSNRIAGMLFNAVMMQKPKSDSSSKPFKDLLLISENEVEVYMRSMIYYDPAFSQKETACFSALICIGTDSTGRLIARDFLYRKINADTLIKDLLPGFIIKNNAGSLVYENNSAQVLIDGYLRDMIAAHGLSCEIVGVPSVANKHLRIMGAQPTIVSKLHFLKEKLNDTFSDYAQAVTEIKEYSKDAEYKDATDATAGGVTYQSGGKVGAA